MKELEDAADIRTFKIRPLEGELEYKKEKDMWCALYEKKLAEVKKRMDGN